MPRYYLHIRDGERTIPDEEGYDLPDLDAAKAEAVEGARTVLSEKLKIGELLDGQRIDIMDEAGSLLATVWFRDVFRVG
ncbi:MAG: hypothetical protein K2Y56_05145 [Methylobacterium sp.]|uniref:DUF6894 family protein n=1 Tax=Methylobacterium sp. TaxID=409 RepID=UPI0025E046C2|nr:hypothetical protein [Methylobacterium sp.]MBX9930910.1 hypothetical protein [Methylobacterium sp.]